MRPTKEKLFYFDCEWVPIDKNLAEFESNHLLLYKAFLHQYDKKIGDIIPERKNLETKPENMTLQEFWDTKAHFYPEFCKIIYAEYDKRTGPLIKKSPFYLFAKTVQYKIFIEKVGKIVFYGKLFRLPA